MNFNEYKGPTSNSNDNDTQGEDYSDVWTDDNSDKKPSEPCVGKDCCTDGMTFDSTTQTCKDITEGMISSQLVKGSMGMANDNVNLQGISSGGGSVVMPYSNTENYAAL